MECIFFSFIEYDMNAMILMSCLVFIDLEECTEKLDNLTHHDKPPPEPAKKSKYLPT